MAQIITNSNYYVQKRPSGDTIPKSELKEGVLECPVCDSPHITDKPLYFQCLRCGQKFSYQSDD